MPVPRSRIRPGPVDRLLAHLELVRQWSASYNLVARGDLDHLLSRHLLDSLSLVPWLREVVGGNPANRTSKRWAETPDGYIWAPHLQSVKNQPNAPPPKPAPNANADRH